MPRLYKCYEAVCGGSRTPPFRLLITTICSVGAIAFQSNLARALSPAEVARIARGVTVRIESQAPGSGVIIHQSGEKYKVLTAAHVVATDDTYEVVTTDKARHLIKNTSIKRFPGIDLAIVEFTSAQPYRVATLGNSFLASAGVPCYVSGYPGKSAALSEVIYNFTAGQITANADQPLRDGYGLVYSNATLPGMSGGAVLDRDGKLIGIHGRADTVNQAQNPSINPDIYIKTGFNLGIPINLFLQSSSVAKMDLGFKVPPPKTPTTKSSIDTLLLKGGNELYKGNSGSAISQFSAVLNSKNRDATAHHGRGLAYYQRGDYRKAFVDFNIAVMSDPYNALIRNNRGLNYLALNESRENQAIADFSEAIKINPNFADAFNNRGLAYLQLGARTLAADDFTQTIRLDPSSAKAYKNRGVARNLMNDQAGAIQDLNQAIAINPTYGSAYRWRGRIKFREGDLQGAIAEYDQAVSLNSKDFKTMTYRGIALYEQSQVPKAIADWKRAIAVNPKAAGGAQVLLGSALYAQGQHKEGLMVAKEAIPIDRTWFNQGFRSQVLGKRLLADTQKLIAHPSLQSALKR